MVVKLSGLYKMNPANWQKLAKQTCFRNAWFLIIAEA
jgi:hypothetical protein